MIFIKAKAKDSMLNEFEKIVLPKYSSKYEIFLDEILFPYAATYSIALNKNYKSNDEDLDKKINTYLYWLNKVENSDWMPIGMEFLRQKEVEVEYVEWLFRKLEALASFLHISGKDVNERIERYSIILTELKTGLNHSLLSPIKSIELTNIEKKDFIAILSDDIYNKLNSKRRNYLILRLDSFVSNCAATYDVNILTIEHVLPQNPNENSKWKEIWNDQEREYWVNKLANLVPLAKRQNSAAKNYEFEYKKEKYFKSNETKVSAYTLTTQVLNTQEWTPQIVKERQSDIIKQLISSWSLELNVDSNE
jgi:hypothetical protein